MGKKRYYALLISISFLLVIIINLIPVQATSNVTSVTLTQQQACTPKPGSQADAQQAIAEAQQLKQQGASDQQIIAKYEEVAKYWHLACEFAKEAAQYWVIAAIYQVRGENQKSLQSYQQALTIYQSLDDRLRTGVTLASIGNIYNNLGEYQKALEAQNQALNLFKDEKDTSYQANTFFFIASIYLNLGETQKAFDSFNAALKLWEAKGDITQQTQILYHIALSYFNLGEYQKTYDYFNQAKTINPEFAQTSEASLLELLLAYFAGIEVEKFSPEQLSPPNSSDSSQNSNLAEIQQKLEQARLNDEPLRELNWLNVLAGIYDLQGDYQQALELYNQKLVLLRSMGNRIEEVATLSSIAEIFNDKGDKQQALDYFNQALNVQQQTGNRPGEANTLTQIAKVYESLGAYELSLDAYNRSLSLFQDIKKRDSEAQTLTNIAEVYRSLDNYQQALNHAQQALSICRTTGNRLWETVVLSSIGRIHTASKNYQEALVSANEMLSVSRTLKNEQMEAAAYALTGRIYLKAGNYEKALEFSQQALEISQRIKFRLLEARTFDNLGEIYNALQQPQQAINTYHNALSVWRTLGFRTDEADSLYQIAKIESKRGNLNEALNQINTAIRIIEDIRSQVASSDLRTSFFALVQNYYQLKIDILMQLHKQQPSQGYDALALQTSEESRARTLLEILIEANADIRQGVDAKLLEEERTIQQKLSALEKRRIELLDGNYNQEQIEAIETENKTLLVQYQEIQAKIRANSPRYAALTQPQPLTLAGIQQQVLDDNTLLLEYALGEERSYLWAVGKDGMTSYELPKREQIETLAQNFYQLLKSPSYDLRDERGLIVVIREDSSEAELKSASHLSQLILAPVSDRLQTKRLLIVADGALQYIPFAALPVAENTPLLVEHEIVNLPSASTLAVLRQELKGRQPAPKTIAILADPVFTKEDQRVNQTTTTTQKDHSLSQQFLDRSAIQLNITFNRLPGTRQEAEQILKLIPEHERLETFDFDANLTTATSPQLSQYRFIHFATHGILNSTHPELSGIVFSLVDKQGKSQNGFLRLHEVFNLNLPAQLVVLSACQTGLGQEIKGEGLVGLTRGFMYAGAERIVVSLWSVSDAATAELMVKFYQNILEKDLKPIAALRSAQLEMWENSTWKAPYYWAAFTMQGEWQ